MRIAHLILIGSAAAALGACANQRIGGGGPDEFAVARHQPLVIPPDFGLTPPRPGDPEPGAQDARMQALQALFGGPQPRSAVERDMLRLAEADRAALGARSVAGDPDTVVVERGVLVQTLLQMPQGDGREASVSVPQ